MATLMEPFGGNWQRKTELDVVKVACLSVWRIILWFCVVLFLAPLPSPPPPPPPPPPPSLLPVASEKGSCIGSGTWEHGNATWNKASYSVCVILWIKNCCASCIGDHCVQLVWGACILKEGLRTGVEIDNAHPPHIVVMTTGSQPM